MTVGGVGAGIDYNKWIRDNQNVSKTATAGTKNVSAQQSDYYTSSSGEKCTDGKDDGKIGFFSKVGNVIKGVFKQAGNMVKSAIQHPFKTAALVGACFIPIVGPVITAGLCAYGIYSGGKQIISGIQQAESATTDAAAKDAWQNVGGGGLTLGLSVTGLKGSIKAFKSQVGLGELGADGACQTFKAIKNGESVGEVLKTATSETVQNAANAAKAAGEKIKNGGEKLTEISKSVQNKGLKETASELLHNSKAYQKYCDAKEYLPYNVKAKRQTIIDQAQFDSATKIEYYDKAQTIPKKVTYSDGTVMEYSRAGNLTKSVEGNTTTTINNRNNTTTTTTEVNQNNNMYRKTVNEETGITETKSLSTNEAGTTKGTWSKNNSNTASGYKTVLRQYNNGQILKETSYTLGGNNYSASELNLLQKGYVRLDAGKLGTTIAKANPNAAYVAPFLNPEEN